MLNRHWIALAALLVATGGVYANHFGNGFHFDDSHTIQANPHITSLANAGRFFVDATTFSALPLNQTYRPLLTLSLAFDYWWGGGLKPWVFHVSSFSLYLLQLVFMFLLFRRLLPKDRESTALFGTAIYALHPISAETVNYIIQRGDVMSTAAVVAGLWLYARNPRPFGWHLLLLVLGCLSKPPAVILAPLIFSYVYLFTGADETAEQQMRLNERRPRWVVRRVRKAAGESAPAFALAVLYFFVQKSLTLPMATPPGFQPRWYILTQPWVTLHYFRSFFWPNALTADSDWGQLHSYTAPEFIAGVVFLLVFVGFMVAAGRTREWRVEAFAMAWFILALLPTALTPLAEVMNDHRMYFPHVGTALLVAAVLGRAWRRIPQRRVAMAAAIVAWTIVFGSSAYATYRRNEVWKTEYSLWRDVTLKSPQNGRGLLSYGLTLLARGDAAGALDYCERARLILPDYTYVESCLGLVKAELRRNGEAELHFRRALTLSPVPVAHAYFARFLRARGRAAEARQVLEAGLRMQPDQWDITAELLDTLAAGREYAALRGALLAAQQRFPQQQELRRFAAVLSQAESQAR